MLGIFADTRDTYQLGEKPEDAAYLDLLRPNLARHQPFCSSDKYGIRPFNDQKVSSQFSNWRTTYCAPSTEMLFGHIQGASIHCCGVLAWWKYGRARFDVDYGACCLWPLLATGSSTDATRKRSSSQHLTTSKDGGRGSGLTLRGNYVSVFVKVQSGGGGSEFLVLINKQLGPNGHK